MRKKLRAAISGMAVAFLLCACGSGGESEPVTVTSEVNEEVSSDTQDKSSDIQDQQSAGHKKEIKTMSDDPAERVWIIATDINYKPFEFKEKDGKLSGIDVELFEAIAEDQGFEYDIQAVGWDASIEACQLGEAAGMIAGASITEERINNGWIFSDSYIDVNQCMAVSSGSYISGFDDLEGLRVAVKTETVSAEYAQSLEDKYGFEIEYFLDSGEVYSAVINGRCDACFDDTPVLRYNIKETGLELKIVDGTGNESTPCGMVVLRDEYSELIEMFNKGLADIKANGTYDRIMKKYLGE